MKAGLFLFFSAFIATAQDRNPTYYLQKEKDFATKALEDQKYYDSALINLKKAHQIFEKRDAISAELELHINRNDSLVRIRQRPWAARSLDSVLTWVEKAVPEDQETNYAWLCIQNGYNHYELRSYVRAIEWYQKGLKIFTEYFKAQDACNDPDMSLSECLLLTLAEGYPDLWQYVYRPLVNLHIKIGDFYSASNYLPPLDILEQNDSQIPSSVLFDIYTKYGDLYFQHQDTTKTHQSYSKASTVKGLNPEQQTRSLLNLGNVIRMNQNYEQAQETLTRGLKLALEFSVSKEIEYDAYLFHAYLNRDIGINDSAITEAQTNNYYKIALSYYQKAQSIIDSLPIDANLLDKQAIFKLNVGEIYKLQGDYSLAISHYQEGLRLLLPGYKDGELPPSERLQPKIRVIYTLQEMADCWFQAYQKDQNIEDLERSAQAYSLIHTVEDNMRGLFFNQDARFNLSKRIRKRLAKAMKVAEILFEKSNKDKGIQLALSIIQRSRALELQTANQQQQIEQKELGDIRTQLVFSRNTLFEASYRRDSLVFANQKPPSALEAYIDRQREELRTLNSRVFEEYPAFFKEQISSRSISFEQIQESLKDQELFIAYLWEGEDLYALYLNKDNKALHHIPTDTSFKNHLHKLIELQKSPIKGADEFVSFRNSAHFCYQKLLEDLDNWDANSLIIAADLDLNYIPFEILLTEIDASKAGSNFSTLNYLINEYQIRYTYVPNAIAEKEVQENQPELFYTGFAPLYESIDYSQNNNTRDLDLKKLKFNILEVDSAFSFWKSKNLPVQKFDSLRATESIFRKMAPISQILHVAMHSYSVQSDTAQLVFYPGNHSTSTQNDGKISLIELYKIRLQAELAMLSACETGLGKFQLGEGLISIGRAFKMAGCKNIVSSLWPINDKSSGIISTAFFRYLKMGFGKAEALQQAKLDYLKNNKIDNLKKAPFYWSQFIIFGDNEVLMEQEEPLSEILKYGFVIMIIGVLAYFIWSYLKK